MGWLRRRRGTRLERILADFNEELEATRAPVRAYTKAGRVAHLLGPDGQALCPNMAMFGKHVWLGSGSDDERARLASLPPCHACERAAGLEAS